jgi:hypothetical protein
MEMVTFDHKPNYFSHFAFKASILHFSDVLANAIQLGNNGEQPISPKLEEEACENLKNL